MPTKYVDGSSGGGGDGNSWAQAYTPAEFETWAEANIAADDTVYIKGSCTFANEFNISASDGTATDPITIIGVASGTSAEPPTQADWPTGANRPLIDYGANTWRVGTYTIVRNLRFEGDGSLGMLQEGYGYTVNCSFLNDSGTADRYAWYGSSAYGTRLVDCEFRSVSGRAVGTSSSTYMKLLFCYIHDSPVGLYGAFAGGNVTFCIFDTITGNAWDGAAENHVMLLGNTFYACGAAISETTGYGYMVINNIFSGCTTDAVVWTTQTDINLFMYNHFYNNTDDWDGVPESGNYEDYWATSGDPKFTTAGSDFSLQGDSPCINAGMAMQLGVG